MEKGLFYLFCDESRQDLLAASASISPQNRYCCMGGLMIPSNSVERIKKELELIKQKHHVKTELKWGTVSNSKLELYLDLIDYFFSEPNLSFRTVVIDSTKVDNKTYNNADQELGYYKFYYQLVIHWLDIRSEYRIYTDKKTNKESTRLKVLRNCLNNSSPFSEPILSIQAIDSRESLALQLENILMGAVGYRYNFVKNGKSEAKKRIVERIEEHLGHIIGSTEKDVEKFNVFKIRLRGGQR